MILMVKILLVFVSWLRWCVDMFYSELGLMWFVEMNGIVNGFVWFMIL